MYIISMIQWLLFYSDQKCMHLHIFSEMIYLKYVWFDSNFLSWCLDLKFKSFKTFFFPENSYFMIPMCIDFNYIFYNIYMKNITDVRQKYHKMKMLIYCIISPYSIGMIHKKNIGFKNQVNSKSPLLWIILNDKYSPIDLLRLTPKQKLPF